MAFNLSEVEPLGSKSVLLEQALKRQQLNRQNEMGMSDMDLPDMPDMVAPDYAWLNEDRESIQNLVKQMDASIGHLAGKLREVEGQSERSRASIEKEQKLLFKQIKTLNNLLKKQVDVFVSVERQIASIEIEQNSLLPQIGIGLIAGLMSAITILATAPWMTILMEHLRASM